MRRLLLSLALAGLAAGCGQNVVSSEGTSSSGSTNGTSSTAAASSSGGASTGTDGSSGTSGSTGGGSTGGTSSSGGSTGGTTATAPSRPDYPDGVQGFGINKVVPNVQLTGHLANTVGAKVTGLVTRATFDMQAVRNLTWTDPSGAQKLYRFMVLDVSAGWCPPCNSEAEELGLGGAEKTRAPTWRGKGGIFLTTLVEGYGARGAQVGLSDIATWANDHDTQTPLAADPDGHLFAAGLVVSAYPANIIVNLDTMKIVYATYGADPNLYTKFESYLNAP